MIEDASHATEYVLKVKDDIPAQAAFWRDKSRVRGYVGGLGSGKTFAGALEVLRQPAGSAGIVVAPTFPLLRDATQRTFFEVCPPALIKSHNKTENHTVLHNGTEIFWRSADRPDNLRGPNLHWGWGDEWAYVSEKTHQVVMGRLRRGDGRFWFTTTPNGQNWLYQWAVVRPLGYSLHRGSTADNPHNRVGYAAELAAEYADDPLFAAQELKGEFVDLAGTKRFPATLLAAVYAPLRQLVVTVPGAIEGPRGLVYTVPQKGLRVTSPPRSGRQYVLGCDCAEGLPGGDDSTVVVVDKQTGDTCAVLAGEYEPKEEHGAYIALMSRFYNDAPANIERNNHGHAVIACAVRHGVEVLQGPDGREGWNTTAPSKVQAATESYHVLQAARDAGVHLLHDARLKDQIGGVDRLTLKGPGKGKIAKVDDEVIGWMLAQVGRSVEPIAIFGGWA